MYIAPEIARRILYLLLTVLAYCSSFYIVHAQSISSTTSVKGTVIDSVNRVPLGYVTVVVVKAGKHETAQSSLTNDKGFFQIKVLLSDQYNLTLSYVGYKTKTITLPPFTSPTIDLGTVVLVPTATELEEVKVITLKPLIEQNFDRTIYNFEADPEANSLSTLDMLRKVPYLTIDAEDNLQLNGNNSYQILVNGKRSALFAGNSSEILKILPASTIKKVEVITNPSARYQAAGAGGIINIITHKKSISGYSGSINLGAENPEGYSAGSFLSTTAGKFSASGRYTNRHSESPASRSIFYREDLVNLNRLKQAHEKKGENRSQNINGELSYQFSPQDLITASYSQHNSSNKNKYIELAELLNAADEITEAFQNLNNDKGETIGRDLSLNYEHSFRKNELQLFSLTINTTNSNYSSTSDFILQPILNHTGRISTTGNQDETKEYNLQADYAQPIGKQLLEVGLRSTFEENNSDYYYKDLDTETGDFILDPDLSNIFNYKQNIFAAYVSLNLTMGNWVLRTGARLEETKLAANFRSSGTSTKQSYSNLFPNVTLSRKIKENNRLSLSYNQRINRPDLYSLDPYVDLTDPLNINYGNPDLLPATGHSFQLEFATYVKGTSFHANASHTFTNDAIHQFTVLGPDSVARTTFGNLGSNKNYSFALRSNSTLFRKLTLSMNAGTNYVIYTSILEGALQNSEGFNYTAQGSASYRFGKSWRASGNISYNSSNIFLQGKTSGYTLSSLSLSKQFLKNQKASLNLSVRSPFQGNRRITNETINPTFYQLRESYSVIRQFSLAFNYRFGKLK